MRISEIFELNKSQAQLDFIDINVYEDTPLFLDPFFLSLRNDNWSIEASRTIKDFFQRVISLIREDRINEAKELFQHLDEPNSTCLGMSRGIPRGRGVGRGNTDDIFTSIITSNAIQTGLVQDLEDNLLFVNGFGKDKLSDMTTNIITKHLIDYTQDQCKLHGIKLNQNVPTGFYWNRRTVQWEQNLSEMLIINNRIILLVPKGIVSFTKDYTGEKYYTHFVLNFMQNEHLRLNSALVKRRANGDLFVTKKDIKEQYPYSKAFLADFTRRNPQILQNFKNRTKIESLNNNEIIDVNINDLKEYLITSLIAIPSGNENATKYHRHITGILEFLFYPNLIYPTLELEIHDGRKRIDLTFDNASKSGIFFRLSNNFQLSSQYIYVECKNYSSDPTNPEIDQLSGRFSPNRGTVGFLLCRTINNLERFLQRCKDTYRDSRGLIIPLADEDIINLLQNHNERNTSYLDIFLSDRIRDIMTN